VLPRSGTAATHSPDGWGTTAAGGQFRRSNRSDLLTVAREFGIDHSKVFAPVVQRSQHCIEQSLGCGGVAAGRLQGLEDLPLPRNPGLSMRDVLFGKNVVLVFT
jgi:hypothetical protein